MLTDTLSPALGMLTPIPRATDPPALTESE